MDQNIFKEFYINNLDLKDRKILSSEDGVDVIIPVMNTTRLWERNLYNFYERIPIERLLIGDGGCKDNTISIVQKFPRVEIIDQSSLKSLGYSINELIKHVKTQWFIYLHSDVFLPENWYENMCTNKHRFDWFECERVMSVMINYKPNHQNTAERAYSGSQMGKTEIFRQFSPKIDDDYLYRNEDIVFSELVKSQGGKYGRTFDTFHYHQVLNREGELEPKYKEIKIIKETDLIWEKSMLDKHVRGIIKYLRPKGYLNKIVVNSLSRLDEISPLDWHELTEWTKKTNPIWLSVINNKTMLKVITKRNVKKFIFKYALNRK